MTDNLLKHLLKLLSSPFPPDAVEWRVGATNREKTRGLALAYIDARAVQDRLDEVCGVYWQVRHHHAGGEKLACDIGIKIGEEWIWRGDGAGASDVEAEKGAFSDSFKRAAVRWGVGRYLYDIDSPWVELEAKGNTHVIPDRERTRLRTLLTRPQATQQPPYTKYDPKTTTPLEASQKATDEPKYPPTPNGGQPSMPSRNGSAGSEEQQLTLSQLRDRLMDRINKTKSPEELSDLFTEVVGNGDLALFDDAHPPTADMLRRLFDARRTMFP